MDSYRTLKMKRIILKEDGTFKHWHTHQSLSETVEVANGAAMELSQNTQTKQYNAVTKTVVDVVATQAELDAIKAGGERDWRNVELRTTDINILKAEDIGADTAPLRAYRQALRDYPQQSDFPSGTRPTA